MSHYDKKNPSQMSDEEFYEKFVGEYEAGPDSNGDRYVTVAEMMESFGFMQKTVAAQIPTSHTIPSVSPSGVAKVINSVAKQSGYNSGGRSNAAALALALQNNWDVVVPKGDELFIDIDSDEQLAQHYRAMVTFDKNICRIVDHVEQSSKSGAKGRYHVYIRLDMTQAKARNITNINNALTKSARIGLQLMLCSDAVREMLSQDRLWNGDPYPTIFFELPGKAPTGFGTVIQPAQIAANGLGAPPAGMKPVVSSAPPPSVPPPPGVPTPIGYFYSSPKKTIGTSPPAPTVSAPPDPSRYPHQCPKCGGPSYNGLLGFDCMAGCKP